jgi:tetratricopeptide (TPR) repeat protein
MRLQLLDRFMNAVAEADRAYKNDRNNTEVSEMFTNVQNVAEAWENGKKLYRKEEYLEAEKNYLLALQWAKTKNVTLLNNLADCQIKLENWKKCAALCKLVLAIQPQNEKALRQHDFSCSKVESNP